MSDEPRIQMRYVKQFDIVTDKRPMRTDWLTLSHCAAYLTRDVNTRDVVIELVIDTPENGIRLTVEDVRFLARFVDAAYVPLPAHEQEHSK